MITVVTFKKSGLDYRSAEVKAPGLQGEYHDLCRTPGHYDFVQALTRAGLLRTEPAGYDGVKYTIMTPLEVHDLGSFAKFAPKATELASHDEQYKAHIQTLETALAERSKPKPDSVGFWGTESLDQSREVVYNMVLVARVPDGSLVFRFSDDEHSDWHPCDSFKAQWTKIDFPSARGNMEGI